MVLLEERMARGHTHTPSLNAADLRTVLGVGAPVEIPMAHRPGINIRLVPSLRSEGWNAEHGRVMRGMESLIALSLLAYFGTGLLGIVSGA